MCGILGAVGKFNEPIFEKGLNTLAHRGPDGAKIWREPHNHILLGHRRLAILDLSDLGTQPMVDDELVIVYNGELYNFIELKKQLETKGHIFHSHSDTEVILKAYRQWGPLCLEKFNGMWALAIWDNKKRKMFLARDRFGVKPLFYAFTKNGFVFGSEMKSLAPFLDNIEVSEDFNWCKNNIYSYETSEKALIKGIKRFPAAHFAYFTTEYAMLKFSVYWDTLDHISPVEQDYDQQVTHFRELFLDACKIRMRSDVKIGTALSGGLDSSSVVAAMHHCANHVIKDKTYLPHWQNAFVATFEGTELDEREYANTVVSSLNLKGYFYNIDGAKGIHDLNNYLWHFEELFLTSPIPMVEIYKAIKGSGVTVSLDGHGADELLSGYGTTIFNAVKDKPFDIKSIKEISSAYKQSKGINKSDLQVLIDGFAGRKNLVNFYLSRIFGLTKHEDELVSRLGYFNAALYKEFHSYILPTLLRNYDRYSMTSGVEVRMPFMDYRLVSYCFSLPWQSKLRGGFTKAILRDAIQPFLAETVVRRKSKIGFSTPFTNWFQGSWKEFIKDTVASNSFKHSNMIDAKKVKDHIDIFYSKQSPSFEDGPEMWRELMPYFWEVAFYNKLKEIR